MAQILYACFHKLKVKHERSTVLKGASKLFTSCLNLLPSPFKLFVKWPKFTKIIKRCRKMVGTVKNLSSDTDLSSDTFAFFCLRSADCGITRCTIDCNTSTDQLSRVFSQLVVKMSKKKLLLLLNRIIKKCPSFDYFCCFQNGSCLNMIQFFFRQF